MDQEIQVLIHEDTTGSMSPCIGQVRRKVEGMFTDLLKNVPNLKVALGANGDYCDRGSSYVTKWHDFSSCGSFPPCTMCFLTYFVKCDQLVF